MCERAPRSSSAVIDVFRNPRLRLCDRCECHGRAIIHNSDYKSIDDAKVAIDPYFAERNEHFRQHPRATRFCSASRIQLAS
jgi:hypothetical protein